MVVDFDNSNKYGVISKFLIMLQGGSVGHLHKLLSIESSSQVKFTLSVDSLLLCKNLVKILSVSNSFHF